MTKISHSRVELSTFGNLAKTKGDLLDTIADLDRKEADFGLSDQELKDRGRCKEELLVINAHEESGTKRPI